MLKIEGGQKAGGNGRTPSCQEGYILPHSTIITTPGKIPAFVSLSGTGLCGEDDFRDSGTPGCRREWQESFRPKRKDIRISAILEQPLCLKRYQEIALPSLQLAPQKDWIYQPVGRRDYNFSESM